MAPKPTATLTLADGETVVLDLDERNPQEALYNLLNREGEYAGGWVEVHGGYWVISPRS